MVRQKKKRTDSDLSPNFIKHLKRNQEGQAHHLCLRTSLIGWSGNSQVRMIGLKSLVTEMVS